MPISILMPALSPTMTEGNLAKWLKKEGDKISPGEVIAEIETDKATMEVEAVDAGILAKILVPAGTEAVAVNQLIAVVLEEGEDAAALSSFLNNQPASKTPAEATEQPQEIAAPAPVTSANKISEEGSKIFASPLAKRVAQSNSIDLAQVTGSGPHGRIIKADVLSAVNSPKTAAKAQIATMAGRNSQEYTKVPNSMMRKVIAKRLLESKQTIPHFYLNIECVLDKLLQLRAEINEASTSANPYKISVNDLVIKASSMALRVVPEANASWSEEAILMYNNVDISVAVAIEGGLITPIIRNADQKSVTVISNEMKDLATRAKANKLAPQEFQGGGFSISNLGMYNIKNFNAIVNPPQGCILAVGAGSERAIVRNGQIIAANMMDVTLSCDHRVVDGAVAATFLNEFRKYIENPITMLV
jgi:pyruvate dehydrogenase E2 component (dihydrolipoamide acetyltransferase)